MKRNITHHQSQHRERSVKQTKQNEDPDDDAVQNKSEDQTEIPVFLGDEMNATGVVAVVGVVVEWLQCRRSCYCYCCCRRCCRRRRCCCCCYSRDEFIHHVGWKIFVDFTSCPKHLGSKNTFIGSLVPKAFQGHSR